MSEDWDCYRYLLAMTQRGGLNKAARSLGVSQPTVGRKIKQLEEHLGARLFDRTTNGYRLTEAGHRVVAHAEVVLSQLKDMMEDVRGHDTRLEGPVVVTLTEAVAHTIILPSIVELQAQHPGIEIQLRITNQKMDLHRREADIAIRFGDPGNETLVGVRVGRMSYSLYGAHQYLETRGQPHDLDGLSTHLLIDAEAQIADVPQVRQLRQHAPTAPTILRCNSILAQYRAMLAGLGLVALPDYVVNLHRSSCVRLLGTAFSGSCDVWLLTSEDARRKLRVQVTMNFLKQSLRRHFRSAANPP